MKELRKPEDLELVNDGASQVVRCKHCVKVVISDPAQVDAVRSTVVAGKLTVIPFGALGHRCS